MIRGLYFCLHFSAEQKLKDKLAAAMREKMTQVTANTREKTLQAERKKKASMFVSMLKAKKREAAASAGTNKPGEASLGLCA